MNVPRTLARAGAVLAAAGLLVPLGQSPAAARGSRSDMITMTVDSVSPAVPEPTQRLRLLTVTLTLTNTTSTPITDIHITGERGTPISNQQALDDAIAAGSPPSAPGLRIEPTHPVTVASLGGGQSVTTTFETTTGIPVDTAGICICATAEHPWIDPLFFSAHKLIDGVDDRLGVAATYLPIFYKKPPPVQVSWIWPLLEPPHRLASSTEFLDDDLATSVSTGRLSRALSVVEAVRATVPLTLLVDPELLDELEVMATEPYTVVTSGSKSVPGTGQAAAADWLRRLSDVLQADPSIQVKLTPYADPDVESLAQRGMTWTSKLPTAMVQHVSEALAGRQLDTSLAWPATGAVSEQTLRALYAEGMRTIVLNSTSVGTATPDGGIPPGLTRFNISGPNVVAALTSPAIEKYVRSAIVADGAGAAALPPLLAEMAVRAVQEPVQEHALTITAPRYIDPDVGAAVAAIEQTSRSLFTEPISLGLAVEGSLVGTNYSHLLRVPASVARHESPTLDAARDAVGTLPVIAALLDQRDDARARSFVASLPAAIQRAKSSAWRAADFAAGATRFVNRLRTTVTGITDGVRIVGPTSGSYTLASDNSPLPITVENDLPYEINVRVRLAADNHAPGFSARDIGTQHVERNQRHTFKIPTTVERVGTINIHAQLYAGATPLSLGDPVSMRVRSTAFGIVGVIITVVAGVALAVALLWRVFRRLRARRAQKPPAAPVPLEPEPVS